MSERPVSETGNLIRSGFLDIEKTKELLNTLKIEELSQVANPDEALLLLVRILEKNNKEFEKTIEDESIRFRLLKVLGSSSGLGEFLINHPEDIEVLSKDTAINLAFSKEELTNRFKMALEDGRASLVREYKKFLLSLAARDLCSNWKLRKNYQMQQMQY
jgi:glutamate-ammonia-ligase adenylyltransferase